MRFAIDAIDEDIARLEGDDEGVITLPRWMLPSGAREGDVVLVERSPGGASRVTVIVTVDQEEGKSRRERSQRTIADAMKESRGRDPGGDVSL